MKRLQKGFTLIELLVVIAIIGILAAVVLVNVNSARQRARAASVQSQLSQLRSAMELNGYTTSTNTYLNPLSATEPTIAGIRTRVDSNAEGGDVEARLRGSGGNGFWFMAAQTRDESNTLKFYCVDSTGASRFTSQAPANSMQACPES